MKIYRFVWPVVLLPIFSCAETQNYDSGDVRNVSAPQFKVLIEQGAGQLVDIRTPGEFQQGHIHGAVLIDFYSSSFREDLDRLDKNTPIYIYCRSGNRTSQSLRILEGLGFREIVNLQHGLIDWQRNGFSLTTG